MKISFILFSIVAILVIGLSYDFLAYGDHPDPIKLTFNQESYEYGDTIIITAQLKAPFESVSSSPGTNLNIEFSNNGFPVLGKTVIVNSTTGIAIIEIPLVEPNGFKIGEITVRSSFITYYVYKYNPNAMLGHTSFDTYTFLINSDADTTLLSHMKTLKSLNSTVTTDHKQMSFIQSSLKHFDDALITMSGIFHIERLDIDKLQNFTSSMSNKLSFAIVDIEILQDSSKSMQKEIDKLKKQVKAHSNNGTKHHGHP